MNELAERRTTNTTRYTGRRGAKPVSEANNELLLEYNKSIRAHSARVRLKTIFAPLIAEALADEKRGVVDVVRASAASCSASLETECDALQETLFEGDAKEVRDAQAAELTRHFATAINGGDTSIVPAEFGAATRSEVNAAADALFGAIDGRSVVHFFCCFLFFVYSFVCSSILLFAHLCSTRSRSSAARSGAHVRAAEAGATTLCADFARHCDGAGAAKAGVVAADSAMALAEAKARLSAQCAAIVADARAAWADIIGEATGATEKAEPEWSIETFLADSPELRLMMKLNPDGDERGNAGLRALQVCLFRHYAWANGADYMNAETGALFFRSFVAPSGSSRIDFKNRFVIDPRPSSSALTHPFPLPLHQCPGATTCALSRRVTSSRRRTRRLPRAARRRRRHPRFVLSSAA